MRDTRFSGYSRVTGREARIVVASTYLTKLRYTNTFVSGFTALTIAACTSRRSSQSLFWRKGGRLKMMSLSGKIGKTARPNVHRLRVCPQVFRIAPVCEGMMV